ncbi:hypothetical protein CLIB1423_16S02872 [[Candida] railenensis]|uniref:Uncharacterized protein n=1 Tax=[Candida] railenensis TaxID=45579 RepID=A0A9P0QTH2_9ASCO|nr:hypothetical protein CLIB1423_16S02872 [[Candida] railenensis]
MKIKKLRELIEVPKAELVLHTRSSEVTLRNQTCHTLFKTHSEKNSFYSSLSKNSEVLIFDCDLNLSSKESGYDNIVSIYSSAELLQQLTQLYLNPSTPLSLQQLRLVIIENISVFYWTLKLGRDLNYYVQLADLLSKITQKYGCNAIVTSWDNDYERGYNYNRQRSGNEAHGDVQKDPNQHTLQNVSYLPRQYYDRVDLVTHYGGGFVFEPKKEKSERVR